MDLVNFNDYRQNQRMYGGTAGRKMGITYGGKEYLLKFPGNLKEKQMKNINLSYSNSPVCEYIGSKIYELVGLPVHNTILGVRNEKIVVACEDFLADGDRLYEFDKIKVTFEPHFLDSNGNETNGVGVDLYEIHPFLQDVLGVAEHFWNMFVMDALIGNTDRNNSKWDDEKMQIVMNDAVKMEAEAYKARRCIYELQGKRINPYYIMESMEYQGCSDAIRKLVPKIGRCMGKLRIMIEEIPILSEVQKRFFTSIIECRYEKVLLPVCRKIMEREFENLNQKRGRCR